MVQLPCGRAHCCRISNLPKSPRFEKVTTGYAVTQDLGAFADAFKGRITPDTINLDIRIELLTAVLALPATVDSERLSTGFPGRGRRARCRSHHHEWSAESVRTEGSSAGLRRDAPGYRCVWRFSR